MQIPQAGPLPQIWTHQLGVEVIPPTPRLGGSLRATLCLGEGVTLNFSTLLPGAQECWLGGQTSLWVPGLWSLVPGPAASQGWVLRTAPKNELSCLIVAEDGGSPSPRGCGSNTTFVSEQTMGC